MADEVKYFVEPLEDRFIDDYLLNKDYLITCNNLGIKLHEEGASYYVYFLIDPFDNKIFYIGKGKGKRKEQHFKEYQKLAKTNAQKLLKISDIVAKGRLPLALVFAEGLSELDAYALVYKFIKAFKDLGITNISEGFKDEVETSKDFAKLALSKIIPFKRWLSIKFRSDYDIEMYHFVVKGFKHIAEHGQRTVFTCTTTHTLNHK